ncbi:MAG TPA: hypothetical protein VFK13_15480 [Gemmatimonadaceae bacterium]|nr:hypothetical protein [Gemmatimonadaceae bacterium]
MTVTAENTLRHQAYFEQLDAIGDDAHPDFHAVAAGLYTLRLFDSWVTDGCGSGAPDARQLAGARTAIEAAPPSATMRVLGNVVEAIATAQGVDGSMVLPALLAYARALHFEARWALAEDVYDTVISVSPCVSDDELLLSAMHMRGYTMRMQGRLDEAAVAYKQLRMAAEFVGDTKFVMEARLSEALLATQRGNLPQAERALDELRSHPEVVLRPALRSRTLHARSIVAGKRGDLSEAVVLGHEALQLCKDSANRERILGDIANTLTAMGEWNGARTAFMIIACTAQERYLRWMATINLMEIAFLERRHLVFDQYRRELCSVELPHDLQALYLYTAAQGFRIFGSAQESEAALESALAIAQRYGINELIFKIEALQALPEVTLPETDTGEAAHHHDVAEVVDALTRMLEEVNVSTVA